MLSCLKNRNFVVYESTDDKIPTRTLSALYVERFNRINLFDSSKINIVNITLNYIEYFNNYICDFDNSIFNKENLKDLEEHEKNLYIKLIVRLELIKNNESFIFTNYDFLKRKFLLYRTPEKYDSIKNSTIENIMLNLNEDCLENFVEVRKNLSIVAAALCKQNKSDIFLNSLTQEESMLLSNITTFTHVACMNVLRST